MAVLCCLTVLEWGQNPHCKALSSSFSPVPLLPFFPSPPPPTPTPLQPLWSPYCSSNISSHSCYRNFALGFCPEEFCQGFPSVKFLIFLCLLTAHLLNRPKVMDTTQSSFLLIPYLLILSPSFLSLFFISPGVGWGLPLWLSGREFCLQYGRISFDPWVKKILWRRKWQPTPVFLPGKAAGQWAMVQRVRPDLATK